MKTTIDKLFNIVYGQREYHDKGWLDGNEGNTILISSKGEDNGVYGLYDIEPKFKAPFITVQGYGTIGHAFVQEKDCAVDDHMLILFPKEKMELTQLYEVAYQIRLTKWKYKYGRGITPDRLKKQVILLTNSKKNWPKLQTDITPIVHTKKIIRKPKEFRTFKVRDLFSVEKGKGLYLEKMEEGKTPVISTQVSSAGVCGFYDIEATFKSPSITIGRIMCNPSVQLQNFSTVPDDMFVLTPNAERGIDFLLYASAIIKRESWRFNYSRKVTKEKLETLNLTLPINDEKIDYAYIRQVAENSYGYDELTRNQ